MITNDIYFKIYIRCTQVPRDAARGFGIAHVDAEIGSTVSSGHVLLGDLAPLRALALTGT